MLSCTEISISEYSSPNFSLEFLILVQPQLYHQNSTIHKCITILKMYLMASLYYAMEKCVAIKKKSQVFLEPISQTKLKYKSSLVETAGHAQVYEFIRDQHYLEFNLA